jgi:hypothetical protein
MRPISSKNRVIELEDNDEDEDEDDGCVIVQGSGVVTRSQAEKTPSKRAKPTSQPIPLTLNSILKAISLVSSVFAGPYAERFKATGRLPSKN